MAIKERRPCIAYPQDTGVVAWEVLISLILLVSCVTTPVNLAFPDLEPNHYWYGTMHMVIDIMFAIDILFNFNTAFEDETFMIRDDRKEIACRYIKGWFWIDTLAVLPFDGIVALVSSDAEGTSQAN